MYRLPFFCLFIAVSGHLKNPHPRASSSKQGQKQSRQANKAVGPVCFVLCLLQALAL
jgi:hypothetical protein